MLETLINRLFNLARFREIKVLTFDYQFDTINNIRIEDVPPHNTI